jgi:3-keto-5-aminohexanoate cleavage enzyme
VIQVFCNVEDNYRQGAADFVKEVAEMSSVEDKVVILVAPNGERTSGEGGIYVPITPREIAEDAYRCYQAGASVVHVHGRDEKTGYLSADPSIYNETFGRIREKCDMLIEMTGNMGPLYDPAQKEWVPCSEEQRMTLLLETDPPPDMVPTTVGTMEMMGPAGHWAIFESPPHFLRKYIPAAIKRKILLELEIWDTSFLSNASRLADEGVFDRNMPLVIHYCSADGNGVQSATPRQLLYVLEEGKQLFPKAKWYTTARSRKCFQMLTLGLVLGCNILRVGAEDNTLLPDGKVAKNNVELVETAVRIARDLGRDIATVDEARKILRLPE